MTGWQLTANKISAPRFRHCWHQLAGMVLIRLGAMACGCTPVAVAVAIAVAKGRWFAKNKQKIQYQTSCLQYLHMANISDGDKDTLIIQVLSVVISLFIFTLSCPVTFTVSKHSFLF